MLTKRIFSFLIIILMVLSLTACSKDYSKSDNTNETTRQIEITDAIETTANTQLPLTDIEAPIYVNSELLQNGVKALISDDFVKIPFVSVFEALGASVSWESDTNATISYNGNVYLLDTNTFMLNNTNLSTDSLISMFGVYGGKAILYTQGKEVISDSHNLTILFQRLDIDVNIKYDKTNNLVQITAR